MGKYDFLPDNYDTRKIELINLFREMQYRVLKNAGTPFAVWVYAPSIEILKEVTGLTTGFEEMHYLGTDCCIYKEVGHA